jgi:sulfur relay (sulfurtransferase) DsrC/TusE family protein
MPFVPLANRNPNRLQYDKECYIHYEREWKLTVNNRQVAKQTEQDLVLAPDDLWNESLMSKTG